MFCAAGLKPPVSEVAAAYENRFRAPVQIQYGGSGTLLANLRVVAQGDLFIAADPSYLETARSQGLVAEVLSLAYQTPVLAVRRGNPRGVRSLQDVVQKQLAVGFANPGAAAVGKVVREALIAAGEWEAFEKQIKVLKPTVNDVANDLKLGTIEVGVIWDATARQYPELEALPVGAWNGLKQAVQIGVLKSSTQPTAALRFARFLCARDEGLKVFERSGYQPVVGDAWTPRPELVLFSGGINRLAIEPTLQAFEQREGVRINRVYNGCGILVAQMGAGTTPDAFLACDVSFLDRVKDRFAPPVILSDTELVMLVQKGNPRRIYRVQDLAQPGLRVGLGHPQQSALGFLTEQSLRGVGLAERVYSNAAVQTPTADLLVNQMRAGGLDVAVVFRANTSQVQQQLEVVPWSEAPVHALQPYAVARGSAHSWLAGRLAEALRSAESRRSFEQAGFRWQESAGKP